MCLVTHDDTWYRDACQSQGTGSRVPHLCTPRLGQMLLTVGLLYIQELLVPPAWIALQGSHWDFVWRQTFSWLGDTWNWDRSVNERNLNL